MAKRHHILAARRRAELLADLGGECKVCGANTGLELDCIEPQGDSHHRWGPLERTRFYVHQRAIGNLQILCGHCNRAKSDHNAADFRAAMLAAHVAADVYRDCGIPRGNQTAIEFARQAFKQALPERK